MSGEDGSVDISAGDNHIQKLVREANMLRELATILNSSLDLETILHKLVVRTTELCEVGRCAVWLLEGTWNRFRPVTYYITPSFFSPLLRKSASTIWMHSLLEFDNPIIQRLLDSPGILYIEDLRQEEGMQNFAEQFVVHAALLMVLTREGRPVGIMSLDTPGRPVHFTEEQVEMASAIAQQATIAIDNARLYQHAREQQRRADRLIERARAIYELAKTVNSGEELSVVLRLATGHLVRILEADSGLTMLLDADGTTLYPTIPPNEDEPETHPRAFSLEDLPNVHQAVRSNQPALLRIEMTTVQERAWLEQFQAKSLLIVPLMNGATPEGASWEITEAEQDEPDDEAGEGSLAEQQCVGLIAIHYTRRRKPTSGEYAFAQDIAAQCALAIEKARLLDEARQAARRANQRAQIARTNAAAMHEANVMKDEFLAITAHEFRNPLAVILARSQGALRALNRASQAGTLPETLPDAIKEHLEIIAGQSKQLNNIVTTFLDAARLNQGQFPLKMEQVDLGQIVRQVIENQSSLDNQHVLRYVIRNTREPYLVMGDQARLAQVIANLVENAIKYSPHGGPVVVALRRQKRGKVPTSIEVSVSDRGMGIPQDAQARLFDRFYRVPTANETRGVGLGLYIVAQLIQKHGGEIHVESSGIPGKGSRFIFNLPALPLPDVAQSPY